ncbi:MAG TPA: DUF4244 domain-containing protein [Acidimicrobiia bacterium]|nr:DUF4244 domain-containing protein [Acidimicrobiia bacterium]
MQSLVFIYHYFESRIISINEKGQSTAEYALVILGAAALAVLLLTWASSTGSISNLFESVISRVMSKAS